PPRFSSLSLHDALPIFQVLPPLYELLFNHALQVVFRPCDAEPGPAPFIMSPHACLEQVGFEPDEALLPYALPSRLGYRLLTELRSEEHTSELQSHLNLV